VQKKNSVSDWRKETRNPQFEADLAEISNQGFGLDLEETAEGACCIGLPSGT